MRRWAGLLVIACLMLAACQRPNRTENDSDGASIDGIQFQGVFYAQWTMVTSHPKGVRPLGPADLGRVVGRVVAALLGGIQGRVRRIGVYSSGEPLRLLGSIEDPRQTEHLVRLVLRAPAVEQDPARGPQDDEHYVVSFHLRDGTAASRLFNAKTGYLAGGVVVPDQFTAAVREAIGRHREATAP